MISKKLPQIFYGGDYSPEQWPESVWLDDMRLMKQAGVNLVSVGIFSWALLQPNEDTFDFQWFDKLLDLLAEHGIYVDLATATAAQPAWLSKKYPDVLPVDEKGIRFSYGSRQSYCPNSPSYRRLSRELVRRLAERYRNHPALALWHINNEYACHTSSCYCDTCAEAFRVWLQNKYGSVAEVNEAWGTNFWSQYYYHWDEIIPPRYTSTFSNPSQVLDYQRFMSDSIFELYQGEYDIIKSVTPDILITTNFMVDFKPLDYFKWAKQIDVISWDSYPNPEPDYDLAITAFNHDLMRSLKGGQPFFLMEQASSQINWRPYNTNKRPGVMNLWSKAAVARGADGVMFFQWRQSVKGAEKFHSAMVPHAGENSRVYQEIAQLGKELTKLSEIIDTRIKAETAIIFDYENWWAVEYQQRPSQSLNYLDQLRNFYKPLFELNIPTDIVPVDCDLSHYQLVIAPLLYMIKPGVKENLEKYVAAGGTLIVSFFSGIVDETDGVFGEGYPGPLKELLGISVEEFDALEPHMANKVRLVRELGDLKGQYNCSLWGEMVKTDTAAALALFGEDYYGGAPCLTENQYRQGKAYYLATQPEPEFYRDFLRYLCRTNHISPTLVAPTGVEVTKRKGKEAEYLFILNHNPDPVTVNISGKYRDLIGDQEYERSVSLDSKASLVLKRGNI